MIPDDKVARLWGLLERSFNLAVCSIGTGLDENHQRCAQVAYLQDAKIDMRLLPDNFEGEQVKYTPYARRPQAL